MGRFGSSWQLTKESWGVLKKDKELMWMPMLAFLASVVSVLAVTGLFYQVTPELYTDGVWNGFNAAVGLALYIVLAFITVYFHAATVHAANERLSGGDPTIGSALRGANKHLGRLFLWAIVVATVNLILQAIRERVGIVGDLAVALVGGAWNLATYFVVPNLLFSDDGVGKSLKTSGSIFRKKWGETVVGHIGVTFVFMIITLVWIMIPGAFLMGVLSGLGTTAFVIGFIILVLGAVIINLIGSVLSAIYKTALYRYAIGESADGFSNLQEGAYAKA